ncbi:MAG: hypothetical protein QW303_05380, partial [Nitrososphaerota archaeon]
MKPIRIVKDPEIFLTLLDNELANSVQSVLEAKSEEWAKRNPVGTVSGSSFSVCDRQAWYKYHTSDNVSTPDNFTKKLFWLGFMYERAIQDILTKLPGKLHVNQNSFPLNMHHPEIKDITFSATTDFVKEYADEDKTYYIPIEIKSTQLYKWKDFTYQPAHLRQLLLWIYYAKKHKLNVPYGILKYIQRSDFDTKTVVISVDTPFKKIGRVIESFEVYEPYLEKKINTMVENITKKTLPIK